MPTTIPKVKIQQQQDVHNSALIKLILHQEREKIASNYVITIVISH